MNADNLEDLAEILNAAQAAQKADRVIIHPTKYAPPANVYMVDGSEMQTLRWFIGYMDSEPEKNQLWIIGQQEALDEVPELIDFILKHTKGTIEDRRP